MRSRALLRDTLDKEKDEELMNRYYKEQATTASFQLVESLEYSWDSDHFHAQKILIESMKKKYNQPKKY